ncbi:MAG: hypothetical protein WCP97_01795 [bacterium]
MKIIHPQDRKKKNQPEYPQFLDQQETKVKEEKAIFQPDELLALFHAQQKFLWPVTLVLMFVLGFGSTTLFNQNAADKYTAKSVQDPNLYQKQLEECQTRSSDLETEVDKQTQENERLNSIKQAYCGEHPQDALCK